MITTLLTAAVFLTSAYGGAIHPSHTVLLPLAVLAFPYVLAVTLTVLLVMLVLRQWKAVIILIVALLIGSPTIGVVSPLNLSSKEITDSARTLKIVTFNVRNFGIYDGMQKEVNPNMLYALDQDPDVIIMQEASLTRYDYESLPSMQPLIARMDSVYPYRSHGWHDIIILSKYPYKSDVAGLSYEDMAEDFANEENRFFGRAFDVYIGTDTVRFIGVHLQSIGLSQADKSAYEEMTHIKRLNHNRSSLRIFKNSALSKLSTAFVFRAEQAHLLRKLIDEGPDNLILCGDFNDTPASYSYNTIKGDDLRDAFAECALGPTITYNEHRLYFKIDHVLYRGDLHAVKSVRDRAGDSDHYPQTVTFVWNKK